MKVLLLNQCFYPDVVSTAQHLTDLAVGLAENGHEVTVIASDRGYDDVSKRFPKRETWKGIHIIRISSLALGKQAKWRRAVSFASFLGVCALRLFLLPRFDIVIGLTSPPLISFLGALFVRMRGGKFLFWVMDLNPDEAIAAGWLKESSVAARVLSRFLRYSLQHAEKVIVLDRFMSRRILQKGIRPEKIVVIPPWSHNDSVAYDEEGRRAFRQEHGLSAKYVVMYSGNHSPCHPLDTLLLVTRQLVDNPTVVFCFVGGGSEYEKVKAHAQRYDLKNIVCLPYQPLKKLGESLSAADLHVVVMGDPFVGIVHPCKIYNILEVGPPVLYIGPADSHVIDVLSRVDQELGCLARHGDVETITNYIAEAQKVRRRRSQAAADVPSAFSQEVLLPRMLELIESVPNGRAGYDYAVSKPEGQIFS